MAGMTRRTVIAAAGAAIGTSAMAQDASTKKVPARTTLDVHAHYLPQVYKEALAGAGLTALDGGVPVPEWSEKAALDLMDQTGITGALLSVSSPFLAFLPPDEEARLSRSVNRAGADLRDKYPNRFGVLAQLPLQDINLALAEVRFAIGELKCDGVALPTNINGAYLGHERFIPLLSELNDRKITVFVHPTSPICFEDFNLGVPAPMLEFPFDSTRTAVDLVLSGRIRQFPDIEFIIPHGGGTIPYLLQRIAGIGGLPYLGDKQNPMGDTVSALAGFNYDLALSYSPAQFQALRQIAPVSNILYGSDYPFTPAPIVSMADTAIGNLPLTQDELSMIRHGNAARLFPAFGQRCCGKH